MEFVDGSAIRIAPIQDYVNLFLGDSQTDLMELVRRFYILNYILR
jgi:hypothetical protein